MSTNDLKLGGCLGLYGAILMALAGVAACESRDISKEADQSTGSQIKKWESEGWVYQEVFGNRSESAAYQAHMNSPTASKVTAFASGDDGSRMSKEYSQDRDQYLIVTMVSKSGDSFSLVFSKPR